MQDLQIKAIKEVRDEEVGKYKDLNESSFAAVKGYQGRDKRWHAFIQDRLDHLEKMEVYHDRDLAEIEDARSKLAAEVVSIDMVKDAMAFLNKKRKSKRKWGATGSLRSFVQ